MSSTFLLTILIFALFCRGKRRSVSSGSDDVAAQSCGEYRSG